MIMIIAQMRRGLVARLLVRPPTAAPKPALPLTAGREQVLWALPLFALHRAQIGLLLSCTAVDEKDGGAKGRRGR